MMDNLARPSWDTYFMDITCLVAKRATCLRRKVGAIVVKDRRILASGYNGAPSVISVIVTKSDACVKEWASLR